MALAVALVTLLALIVRLWGLTRQSLWIDEMLTLKYASLEGSLSWEMLRDNLHGPLHAVILHLWCLLFGWGETALRLPQALLSAATVPLLFLAARPTFGPGRALAGALLLAVNPFHIWYAQEVRNYSLVILVSVLAILAMQRLDDRRGIGRVLGLAATWTAGLLSNLSLSFHIAGAALWGVLAGRRRPHLLRGTLLAAVIAAIALLPWEVAFYRYRLVSSHLLTLQEVPDEERLRGDATAPVLGIPYAFYAFSTGFSFGPSQRELRRAPSVETIARHAAPIAVAGVAFGMLAVAGLAGWIGGDRKRRLWLAVLVVPIVLAYLAALRNVKVFNPRYVSVALPAYILLLVDGAATLRRWRLGVPLFAAAVLISLISLYQMQSYPRYWREDARSAAAVLQQEVEAGDLILVVGTWDPIQRYYWRGLTERREIGRYLVPYRVGPGEGEEARRAREAIRAADETYVLFYRDDFHDPQGRWERFLRESYPIEKRWVFPGVRIWRLGEGEVR